MRTLILATLAILGASSEAALAPWYNRTGEIAAILDDKNVELQLARDGLIDSITYEGGQRYRVVSNTGKEVCTIAVDAKREFEPGIAGAGKIILKVGKKSCK